MTMSTQPMRLIDSEDFEIICSCSDYEQHYKSLDCEPVLVKVYNRMRIIGLCERGTTTTLFRRDLIKWGAL